MQDFDVQREERAISDREFVMGGERFTVIPAVDMEVIANYEDKASQGTSVEFTQLMHETILAFLIPEDRERWSAMRERVRETNGITHSDASSLIRWMLERDAQRPTAPSSSSSTGGASGSVTSADGSGFVAMLPPEASPSETPATSSTPPS